ncbi:DUF6233 domain-containing protein [Streptomyces sp. NPDC017993]|uniref:DUF6233 domain-containing protein n=1 Tax=Streptomyces sp. NPDC017993 TaxID=3365027 RepID=UPI00379E9F59
MLIQLDGVRRDIAEVEEWQAPRRSQRGRRLSRRSALQADIGADPSPAAVDVGAYPVGGRRLRRITREEAVEALASGVESCLMCPPARELRAG